MAKKKYEFDNVVKSLHSKGHKVDSSSFLPGKKLECFCSEGHEWVVSTYDYIRRNHRCPKCVGNSKKTLKEIKERLEEFDYSFVSGKYLNCDSEIVIKCPKGHEYTTTWHKFNAGYRCKYCTNLFKKDINFISDFMEKEGYTLLSTEYKNNKQRLKYICNNGHVGYTRWDRFQRGDRCMKCFKSKQSKNENRLVEHLKHKYPNLKIIKGDRKILDGRELDIYIPSKKIAIEYNGLYWHSEKRGKDKYYHYNKMKKCGEKGIRLITIFEDEYLEDKDNVCQRLEKIIENPKVPIFSVSGNYLFSDLCWDNLKSEEIYKAMGYILLNKAKYRTHYFKKQVRLYYPGFSKKDYLEMSANCFWDCGHKVYKK